MYTVPITFFGHISDLASLISANDMHSKLKINF